ncbi:uncharacterized protein K489DRAFT_230240 [Dissoconium aciculare CBS 342.82]|uniref:Uncharacterized protein n=1 Tax=Dissoconium aciculare CBS 342.82 TaxID=1314786 RepID=A0A6J3M571_9PEZI|nr:uncharacterized protein K489DRAFT_230240 [Dissoconium aciculare CBS 342.82]KAF1822007.1 hypothetical protein K489DRAFT_230240 [Dissoconium aciculare CBS 342.82]
MEKLPLTMPSINREQIVLLSGGVGRAETKLLKCRCDGGMAKEDLQYLRIEPAPRRRMLDRRRTRAYMSKDCRNGDVAWNGRDNPGLYWSFGKDSTYIYFAEALDANGRSLRWSVLDRGMKIGFIASGVQTFDTTTTLLSTTRTALKFTICMWTMAS